MSHIDLPRAVEEYFAFAELEPRRDSRRFAITMPYFDGTRLSRFEWWWQINNVKEKIIGDEGVAALREEATQRFRHHIEQWLANNDRRLHGEDPIPRVGAMIHPDTVVEVEQPPVDASNVLPWPADRLATA
ncbi:MAG: hypothetical protein ABIT36_11005 [Steroidobacteraceae bacterium]